MADKRWGICRTTRNPSGVRKFHYRAIGGKRADLRAGWGKSCTSIVKADVSSAKWHSALSEMRRYHMGNIG